MMRRSNRASSEHNAIQQEEDEDVHVEIAKRNFKEQLNEFTHQQIKAK